MKYRQLGNTGLSLTEVGYGAASLFGKDVIGKQGVSEEKAYELFCTALVNGIRFFDTGINYGYAEECLGRCISKAIDEKLIARNELIIESKCGETINPDGSFGPSDWSPDWIEKSLDISLKRLNLEYLDLYALHGTCNKDELRSLIPLIERLKAQNLIKAFGVNSFDTNFLQWLADEKCVDYVMLDYSILRQDREPLIETLVNAGIGVIAGSAMGESLYSKKIFRVKNRNDLWYLARALVRFKDLFKKSNDFKFLNDCSDFTANQLALRYVLDNQNISAAVFGTINTEHLIENIAAVNIEMPADIRDRIKKVHKD